ncbi:hypothetical protein [Kocuria rhizosphaericola]|uniref:hypothetical protein n=1 Tax=Kocuria rhizosphaericola TaxID=3376284 RepID=UPI0037B24A54
MATAPGAAQAPSEHSSRTASRSGANPWSVAASCAAAVSPASESSPVGPGQHLGGLLRGGHDREGPGLDLGHREHEVDHGDEQQRAQRDELHDRAALVTVRRPHGPGGHLGRTDMAPPRSPGAGSGAVQAFRKLLR